MPVSSYSSPHLWSPLADMPYPELWSRPCQCDSGLHSHQRAGTVPSSPRRATALARPLLQDPFPGPWLMQLLPLLYVLCRGDRSSPGRGPLPCPREPWQTAARCVVCVPAGAAPVRRGLCGVCACFPHVICGCVLTTRTSSNSVPDSASCPAVGPASWFPGPGLHPAQLSGVGMALRGSAGETGVKCFGKTCCRNQQWKCGRR